MQPEREHGRVRPRREMTEKRIILLEKPNSQPTRVHRPCPTPSACYRSSSERLSEAESLESWSRDGRRESGSASRAVGQVPLVVPTVSLETRVGDPGRLFLLSVSENHPMAALVWSPLSPSCLWQGWHSRGRPNNATEPKDALSAP